MTADAQARRSAGGRQSAAIVAITEAFRYGNASAVAPFEYSALAWGIGLDCFIWHTTPGTRTLVGGAIIIASGIYLIRKEQVREATPPP